MSVCWDTGQEETRERSGSLLPPPRVTDAVPADDHRPCRAWMVAPRTQQHVSSKDTAAHDEIFKMKNQERFFKKQCIQQQIYKIVVILENSVYVKPCPCLRTLLVVCKI